MYCLRVGPGTEKKQARRIANGFLPMYHSVDEYGRDGKQPVVPGYVFTTQYVPGTVQVPEDEWKMIEALSNPQPSVLDHANRSFSEGPLKAVEGDITEIEAERINVCVKLLGENRMYWLAVEPLDPETAETYRKPIPAVSEEDEDAAGTESGKKTGENGTAQKGPKYTFTEAQIREMLELEARVGIQKAAKEYNVPWQTIAQYKRRDRKAKRIAGAAAGQTAAQQTVFQILPEAPEDEEGLRIQNAVLRERAAELEARAEQLKRALEALG